MNNKISFLNSSWKFVVALAVLVLAVPLSVVAQEQTSSIRGTINAADGSPAAGATVRVTDTRTSAGRSTSTNQSGTFNASALKIGGPYTVTISASGHASQSITDIYVALGDVYTFDVTLSADTLEEIIVTATAMDTVQVAMGPSATFTFQELQDAPAINRDITDVVRMDPRMHIDEAGFRGDSIHCNGAASRFNSLTVDGIRLNDQFGLNFNGYPTARMPFPFDAVHQVAVEMAPFDVQYGGFTACNINAVIRSGTNEFHGQVFYDYTDDSFSGDTLEGQPVDLGSWERERYGVALGGPIIKDKLFFFAAYEYLDEPEIFDRGPSDAPAAGTFVKGVTQAQLTRIRDIAIDTYGYDAGAVVRNLPTTDEKYLLRLDWNINDDHRANFTYMYNDGFNIAESDGDSDEFEFSKHYYERGAELESVAAQWFANWTDNFSTEFRVSSIDLTNRQINIGDNDFGEVQIRTFNNGSRATVYLGADDSRHTNNLNWDTLAFKLRGELIVGDHTISGGWELDDLEVFNLFIQETQGEFEFESECDADLTPTSGDGDGEYVDGCIDQFESGDPDDITYENASGSNNPADAGVTWGYKINSVYLQDEFPLLDGDLTVIAGVRYDWYTSDDLPVENSLFIARNGFSNADNFDGEGLVQPRIGFSWEATDRLSVRGGVGLYSGGNPNVWLSNNYSNTGILTAEADDTDIANRPISDGIGGDTLFNIPTTSGDGPQGGTLPIWNVPQEMFDVVTNASGDFGVNAIDPSFEIPSAWKYALGATYHFDLPGGWGQGYTIAADFQYSKGQDDAIIVDAALEQIGVTLADGRPIYKNVDRADPDCTVGGVLDPLAPGCGDRAFRTDYVLSNTIQGGSEQTSWSFVLSKGYDWGLDWTLGYTHVNSDDVNPMTSSVAFSNYFFVAVSDPNNPGQARSNYEFSDRFILKLQYQKEFFRDLRTSVSVFGQTNAGRPSSTVFQDGGVTFGDEHGDRHLLYVPTGPTDQNVVFGPQFDTTAFFEYINATGLSAFAGGIAPRNYAKSSWWTKFDVRIEQELPGFSPEHRFKAFILIENFGNLLNDDWGVFYEFDFPRRQQVVEFPTVGFDDAGIDPVTGQYLYDRFTPPPGQSRAADASLYEIRFGVSYQF